LRSYGQRHRFAGAGKPIEGGKKSEECISKTGIGRERCQRVDRTFGRGMMPGSKQRKTKEEKQGKKAQSSMLYCNKGCKGGF